MRLTERHLAGDPPTAAQIAAAEDDVRAAIDLVREEVPVGEARSLVGLAGSVTTVAALALGCRSTTPRPSTARGSAPTRSAPWPPTCSPSPRSRRAALPVMHPGRVDVIGAGALILRTIVDGTGADVVVVSEHDILDGIAYSRA